MKIFGEAFKIRDKVVFVTKVKTEKANYIFWKANDFNYLVERQRNEVI